MEARSGILNVHVGGLRKCTLKYQRRLILMALFVVVFLLYGYSHMVAWQMIVPGPIIKPPFTSITRLGHPLCEPEHRPNHTVIPSVVASLAELQELLAGIPRVFVWTWHEHRLPGEVDDRFSGIVRSFWHSINTLRKFMILYTESLADIVIPRAIPWNTSEVKSDEDQTYFRRAFPSYHSREKPALEAYAIKKAEIEGWSRRERDGSPSQVDRLHGLGEEVVVNSTVGGIYEPYMMQDALHSVSTARFKYSISDRLYRIRQLGIDIRASMRSVNPEHMMPCLYRYLFKPTSLVVKESREMLKKAMAATFNITSSNLEGDNELSFEDWDDLNPMRGAPRHTISDILSKQLGRKVIAVGIQHRLEADMGVPQKAMFVDAMFECGYQLAAARGFDRKGTYFVYHSDSDSDRELASAVVPGYVIVPKIDGEENFRSKLKAKEFARLLLLAKSEVAVVTRSGDAGVALALGLVPARDICVLSYDGVLLNRQGGKNSCEPLGAHNGRYGDLVYVS
eukprot:GHVU01228693.1.p1 GENE.GHVU01228693.1~~GHVU01228693.1.p1  ORF type:complete len:509 (+),score=32.82 GHVU01228693.1:163-1689(+)